VGQTKDLFSHNTDRKAVHPVNHRDESKSRERLRKCRVLRITKKQGVGGGGEGGSWKKGGGQERPAHSRMMVGEKGGGGRGGDKKPRREIPVGTGCPVLGKFYKVSKGVDGKGTVKGGGQTPAPRGHRQENGGVGLNKRQGGEHEMKNSPYLPSIILCWSGMDPNERGGG